MSIGIDVNWIAERTATLLAPLGTRWLHVQGVVAQANAIASAFSQEDSAYLTAAAYLHDIGYAPELAKTGFHPLDGARYLRSLGYERLASLVAHHSEARFEAERRGYAAALAKFPREHSAVADALTYCDQHTSPTGQFFSPKERRVEIRSRYGVDSDVYQAYRQAVPFLTLATARTVKRLRKYGISR